MYQRTDTATHPSLLSWLRCFALALFLALGVAVQAHAADPNTAEIVSKSGVHVFAIELAVTDDQRATGLMTVSYTHLTLPTIYSV